MFARGTRETYDSWKGTGLYVLRMPSYRQASWPLAWEQPARIQSTGTQTMFSWYSDGGGAAPGSSTRNLRLHPFRRGNIGFDDNDYT